MAVGEISTTTGRVRKQYEFLPYPHRNPADEKRQLRTTSLDDLASLNHYCFNGRQGFQNRFRVLVAGGGTGDATVFLGHQLRNTDADVVHVDLSRKSMDIAKKRAEARGIDGRIRWQHGSLLEVGKMGLGKFDYINCSGVLHHLEDPLAGLLSLKSVLKDDGAMGLMVYGKYGRTGVYQLQELMRIVNGDENDPSTKLAHTIEMFDRLPPSNWYSRAAELFASRDKFTDTEFYDMFLHSQDRAYSVPELYEWMDDAGLMPVEFTPEGRLFYDPQTAFKSPELKAQVATLPKRQQQAAAELFWGTIIKHTFWVSMRAGTTADSLDPDYVPDFSRFAKMLKIRESMLKEQNENWTLKISQGEGMAMLINVQLRPVTRKFIELIQGQHTIGEIVDTIARDPSSPRSTDEVWKDWQRDFEAFLAYDLLLLRHKSVPALPNA